MRQLLESGHNELRRGETERSAAAKTRRATLGQEEEEEGREAEVQGEMVGVRGERSKEKKGTEGTRSVQNLVVVNTLKPPIFRTQFQCEGSLAIFAVAESRSLSRTQFRCEGSLTEVCNFRCGPVFALVETAHFSFPFPVSPRSDRNWQNFFHKSRQIFAVARLRFELPG